MEYGSLNVFTGLVLHVSKNSLSFFSLSTFVTEASDTWLSWLERKSCIESPWLERKSCDESKSWLDLSLLSWNIKLIKLMRYCVKRRSWIMQNFLDLFFFLSVYFFYYLFFTSNTILQDVGCQTKVFKVIIRVKGLCHSWSKTLRKSNFWFIKITVIWKNQSTLLIFLNEGQKSW